MKKPREQDIRGPAVESMLRALPPLKELHYRVALRGNSYIAGDRAWDRRIEELYRATSAPVADVLRDALKIQKELLP